MSDFVYLEITDLEQFVSEFGEKHIIEVRESVWIRRYKDFEQQKIRLTALDRKGKLVLCLDVQFYNGFVILHKSERKKCLSARKEVETKLLTKLQDSGIRVLNGEYCIDKLGW